MNGRWTWAAKGFSTYILFFSLPAFAQSSTKNSITAANEPAVPIVGVSIDGALSSEMMDAAVAGLDSPVLRGDSIENALRFISLPPEFALKSWEDSFKAGEAAFFKGNLEEAGRRFSAVSALYDDTREVLAFYPALRTAVFKSRIYSAVMAHRNGKTELFDRYLDEAAEIPEMDPSPTEFPPWVCEAFSTSKARATESVIEGGGGIRLVGKDKCVLSVLGRQVDANRKVLLPVGPTFVRVRCGDRSSPVQKVEIKPNRILDFHPAMIVSTRFGRMGKDAVLTAPTTADDEHLISDLQAIGDAMRTDRLTAVLATPSKIEIVLIDIGLKKPVRRLRVADDNSKEAVERAAAALVAPSPVVVGDLAPLLLMTTQASKRPWYRDWVAWTLAFSGAAALGAGIGLEQVYDLESRQAPFAVSLMAVGGGLIASGGILFFVQPSVKESAVSGVTVGWAMGGAF